jgi:hypothetical protein
MGFLTGVVGCAGYCRWSSVKVAQQKSASRNGSRAMCAHYRAAHDLFGTSAVSKANAVQGTCLYTCTTDFFIHTHLPANVRNMVPAPLFELLPSNELAQTCFHGPMVGDRMGELNKNALCTSGPRCPVQKCLCKTPLPLLQTGSSIMERRAFI